MHSPYKNPTFFLGVPKRVSKNALLKPYPNIEMVFMWYLTSPDCKEAIGPFAYASAAIDFRNAKASGGVWLSLQPYWSLNGDLAIVAPQPSSELP